MKRLLMLIVALGSLTIFAPLALAQSGPPPAEPVWVNDNETTYEILSTKAPVPANDPAHEDLNVIGAIDPLHPQSPGHPGVGPHDHVIPAPPHNSGSFTTIWHVMLVVPTAYGSSSGRVECRLDPVSGQCLAYAADLSGTGAFVPLTSVTKIEDAIGLGLVMKVDTGFVFVCPVVKVTQPQ